MKSNFYLSILALGGTLISSCGNFDCITGSGKQVTENRSVGSFTRIETSGSIKAILKQGAGNELKITADDNILKEIETYVSGNTLVIDMEGNFCDAGPVTVYITSEQFAGVEASGAVEIVSDGKLKVSDFELDLSGASKVTLDMDAAEVKTSSSGASEIFLRGQARRHDLDLSGSASVKAFDFVVGSYKIESSGASQSEINVLNDIQVSSSGSSDVKYKGSPTRVRNDESGASSLTKVD